MQEYNLNVMMILVKLVITLIVIGLVLSLKYFRLNKLKIIESRTKDNWSMSHLILTFGKWKMKIRMLKSLMFSEV